MLGSVLWKENFRLVPTEKLLGLSRSAVCNMLMYVLVRSWCILCSILNINKVNALTKG